MEITYEPLHFDNHGSTYKFYLNRCLFHEAFKYGDTAKFWGYVVTNAEPIFVELFVCDAVYLQII
jgi:hypothetical protein